MQRAKYWVYLGLGLSVTGVLAGCHGGSQPSQSYPSTVTPQQMDQVLAQVNSDPNLTPQQKMERINALRSHLHVQPSDSQPR
jgi:cytochrome c-type biogenesis protein CcmH/NrfG